MAIQRFTVEQTCRLFGKQVEAGTVIELDIENDPAKQTPTQRAHMLALGNLLGSDRLRENPFSESSPPEPKAPAAEPLAEKPK